MRPGAIPCCSSASRPASPTSAGCRRSSSRRDGPHPANACPPEASPSRASRRRCTRGRCRAAGTSSAGRTRSCSIRLPRLPPGSGPARWSASSTCPEARVILEVLDGGVLSTVQDAGRPDWTHLGVPPSGATDPRSLAVANLLLGNDRGAAAIEVTLGGARFVATQPGTIALAGAELGAWVHPDRRLAVGRTHRLAAGDQLALHGAADAAVVGSR